MSHLTLVKGGKPTERKPRLEELSNGELLLVKRSTIEELQRIARELKATWDETKESYRRSTLDQSAERRNRALAGKQEAAPGPGSSMEELTREFSELKAAWDSLKKTIHQTILPPPSAQRPELLVITKEV